MARQSAARLSLILGIVATNLACGGNGNTSQASVAPVSLGEAADAGVSAYCGGVQSCCASKGLDFNAALCDSNTRAHIPPNWVCASPGAYDPQAAGDCFAQSRAALSACTPNTKAVPACDRVCKGTLAPGSPCNTDSDCAKPTDANVTCMLLGSPGESEVCVLRPHGRLGDLCSGTCVTNAGDATVSCGEMAVPANMLALPGQAQCFTGDNLYCSSADFSCKPLLAPGATCVGSTDCQAGNYCDLFTSVCTAKLAVGSSCPQFYQCVDSAYCTSAQVCVAKKTTGQPCVNFGECVGHCDYTSGVCVDGATSGFYPSAASCANPTIY
jgi:hypothetical protein